MRPSSAPVIPAIAAGSTALATATFFSVSTKPADARRRGNGRDARHRRDPGDVGDGQGLGAPGAALHHEAIFVRTGAALRADEETLAEP